MRTVINLPNSLLLQVKEAASQAKNTLSDFIADTIRRELARRKNCSKTRTTPLPVFTPPPGMEGLRTGVDLDDSDALLDLMDEADGVFEGYRPGSPPTRKD